jgi:glycosyltransferase involved in cell wall biosynthesis
MAKRMTGDMEAMPANATSEIDYSIVMPVYFNEGELDEAMKSLKHDVIDRNPTLRGEVIFVDDGSGDNSFAELLRIGSTDPQSVTA